jgi:hypothetical protein
MAPNDAAEASLVTSGEWPFKFIKRREDTNQIYRVKRIEAWAADQGAAPGARASARLAQGSE